LADSIAFIRDGRFAHRLGAYLPVEGGSGAAPASVERELVCALPLGMKLTSKVPLLRIPEVARNFGQAPGFKLDAPRGYPVLGLKSLARQDPRDSTLDRFASGLLGFESPPIIVRDDNRTSILGQVLADSTTSILSADNAAMRDYIRPLFLQYFYAKPEEGSIWRSEVHAPLSEPAPREGYKDRRLSGRYSRAISNAVMDSLGKL